MDYTRKPSDLFAKLSHGVAEALAAHLLECGASGAAGTAHAAISGRAALRAAWTSLAEPARQSLAPTLLRLHDLCCRQARSYVLVHACESRRHTCPAVGRVLEAINTADLAVRLYLDDPSAFERAHFQYATALLEQVAIFQGQYIADVIPSYDRRARMLRALQTLAPHAAGTQPQQPRQALQSLISSVTIAS